MADRVPCLVRVHMQKELVQCNDVIVQPDSLPFHFWVMVIVTPHPH